MNVNTGSVYIFQKSDGTWTESKRIRASDADTSDQFGDTIALSNHDQLIVGVKANKDVAKDAKGAAYIFDLSTMTNVENVSSNIPSRIELMPNYPNPFNPITNIQFNLPKKSDVKLTIYNTLGQKITSLIHQYMSAGKHSVTFDATGLPSGVYIYRLKTNEFSQTRKMLLVK